MSQNNNGGSNDDWSWIVAPLLGVLGLLGTYIVSSMSNNNVGNMQPNYSNRPGVQNLANRRPLPPGDCGCNKKIR